MPRHVGQMEPLNRVAEDEMGDECDDVEMDVQQLLLQDEEVKAERLREWCDLHCNRVSADSALKAGRRKGRQARARKRWRRTAGCLVRVRAQNQKIEIFKNYGAKLARVRSGEGWGFVQMMRWGFTVWSWWAVWNKIQHGHADES